MEFDWSDGDVVFANSTCYTKEMMKELADLAEDLLKGAIFLTVSKALPSGAYKVLEEVELEFTWGQGTVFVQKHVGYESKIEHVDISAEIDAQANMLSASLKGL